MLGGLAVPGLVLIGIVALAPIVWLFWLSFRDADGMTLAHYARLLHPSYLITLGSTFELSLLVTIICILLGYPLALRHRPGTVPHRRAAAASCTIPNLDLAAGALLRVARLAATARAGKHVALRPRPHR